MKIINSVSAITAEQKSYGLTVSLMMAGRSARTFPAARAAVTAEEYAGTGRGKGRVVERTACRTLLGSSEKNRENLW